MAITVIQKTPNAATPDHNSGTSIQGTAFGTSVTVGNYVIVFFTQYRTGNIPDEPVFTDTGSNTYTNLITYTNSSNNRATIGISKVTTGGALRITATVTNTEYHDIGCIEVSTGSNFATADTATGTGTGTAAATAQLDRTGNAIYLALANWNASAAITVPTDFTEIHADESFADACMESCYFIDSGNKTPSWTIDTSTAWVAVSAALYENAGGSIVPQAHYYMN